MQTLTIDIRNIPMYSIILRSCLLAASALLFTSCASDTQRRELTPFELEHGIGPVTEIVELNEEPDPLLAGRGAELFNAYCRMCHGPGMSRLAPGLDHLLERYSAEYVMNMILNPTGMTRRHPTRRNPAQGYLTSMPYQQLQTEDARALVEYFRLHPVLFADSEEESGY